MTDDGKRPSSSSRNTPPTTPTSGLTTVTNTSGRPERVLTSTEWQELADGD